MARPHRAARVSASLVGLLALLALLAGLTGCESGLFDDFDGLEPPRLTSRKRSPDRAPKTPPKGAGTDAGRDGDRVAGWEPVGAPDAPPPPPPPVAGWDPVEGGPPPPPPPPGTYQPPVPKIGPGGALPPGHEAAGASAADPLFGAFRGRRPPALGADGKWLVPGLAPSLEGMRGQVVFLMFAFQTCPSCAQMTPYLKQWHEMYGPSGLQVVYVNNGRMASEAEALAGIRSLGLRFAYLHDPEGTSLSAFAVRSFPTAYVIDRAGVVAWEGTPLAVEAQVQELLVGLLSQR